MLFSNLSTNEHAQKKRRKESVQSLLPMKIESHSSILICLFFFFSNGYLEMIPNSTDIIFQHQVAISLTTTGKLFSIKYTIELIVSLTRQRCLLRFLSLSLLLVSLDVRLDFISSNNKQHLLSVDLHHNKFFVFFLNNEK